MNKERREELFDVSNLLQEALDRLEDIRNDEQDALDNLPESFSSSPRANSMQDAIDMMDGWYDRINDIISVIEDYSSGKSPVDQANKRQYKSNDPAQAAQNSSISNHSITINRYNDKSLVVRGNTITIREKLKEFGASFNPRLTGGPGWIIPNNKESSFRHTFAMYI